MIGPIPFVTQFGFAAGMQLGSTPGTAMGARASAQIDLNDVTKTSFFFNMYDIDFNRVVTYFVGKTPPDWANVITMRSLTVNWNPRGVGSGGGGYTPAAASSLVPTGGCSTQSLLNFNAPLPGIVLSILDMNLFGNFLYFTEVTMSIIPSQSLSCIVNMRPFTAIPGISITDATGTTGPQFKMLLNYGATPPSFAMTISGQITALSFVKLAVFLDVTPTSISGFGSLELASFFRAQINFQFNPAALGSGMSIGVNLQASTDSLVNELLNVMNALMDGVNNAMKDAQAGLQSAQDSLVDAKNVLKAAQKSVDKEFGSVYTELNNAQKKVDTVASQCNWYEANCDWATFWNCLAVPGCWVSYGVATAGLEIARVGVMGVQGLVDGAFEIANGAISLASGAVKLAQQAVYGMNYLIYSAKTAMMSALEDVRFFSFSCFSFYYLLCSPLFSIFYSFIYLF
eukprot:TRINITY_DN10049_c0_g1_i1.p1 TRINITY_DN10049_c0_g1~~TRINITY_DN10049_c0_g1_i1.p1  ORF type:complete len:517 (-),score=82.35 TRINITY_DN10049_c0_g1_i1:532-1899(-)